MMRLPPAVRRVSRSLHRDLGYLLTAFVISYCVSGLALNHKDDWDPDFVVQKREISLARVYGESEIDDALVRELSARIGESAHRVVDVPASGRVKIYYDNGSLQLDLAERRGHYERVVRRPLLWDANVLHRNSLKAWRFFSDAFSIVLIVVNVTGLLILKGRHGLSARGKWLIAAGALPPALALMAFRLA